MSSNEPEGLIAVRGTRFVLGEREIVPHGVNSYPLLQHAGDERWDAVDDIFAQAVALGRPGRAARPQSSASPRPR
jgi:hypothetical protein